MTRDCKGSQGSDSGQVWKESTSVDSWWYPGVTRQISRHCLEKLWPFRICLACSSTDEIVGLLSGRKPSLVSVWAAVSNLTVSSNDWVILRWTLQWLLVAEGKVMCKQYCWVPQTPVLRAHVIFHSYHFIFYNICGFSKLELRKIWIGKQHSNPDTKGRRNPRPESSWDS